MQTSTPNNSLTCSLNATTAEITAPVSANCATIAVDGVSENDASVRTDAASTNTSINMSDHPLVPRDPRAAVQDTVDEGAPPPVAAPATSEAALTKLLVLCLDRIHRLEEHQARGEVRQSMFDTSLQALLTQAHGQQQQSGVQAAVEAHRERGVRDSDSGGAHGRELSGQHHCSRQIDSCRYITIDHCDSSSDQAATSVASASESLSEQPRRRHRQPHRTQVSDMCAVRSTEAPAPSGPTMPVDVSAASATATSTAMEVSAQDDHRTNDVASSQHHHLHPGAAPSLSPAGLANTKWKEASSGVGVGIGGGCARAVPSATSAGCHRHTATGPAVVASGSTVEPPMMSHFGVSPSGGCRQRQGSLVTVVSPTHASQAEEAEVHAVAAAAVTVSARAQVSSGNALASASELIGVDVSSAPASATLMSDFTWGVPMALLTSSENSRCSTPMAFRTTARPRSQQPREQHPTPPSAEEEEGSLCINRSLVEHGNAAIHDGLDGASSVHQQQLPLMLQQRQRGSRRHLRTSLTQLLPLTDHPQQQQVRLHPHQPHRRSAECVDRESSSPSRVAPTLLRSVGSTSASSAAHTGDELDALYHALNTPHPSASFLPSSGSAAVRGGGATGTPPRKAQFPPGTDNNTAISELFAQTVQNTMETTNLKDNVAALVRSVYEEREKRRRLQRRVGSALETLFRRVLAMSSVVSRLQRTVWRLELEASSSGAADAANWHHRHSNQHRRCGADSNRSAGVSGQAEEGVVCDGDVDDGESEWRERSCASLSAGPVSFSRSRRGSSVSGSSHRHSIGDRSASAHYAALTAPFPSPGSLSVGFKRVTPEGRSPWLWSPTMRCSGDEMRGEAALDRGGATAVTDTANNTPVADSVGVASTASAAPGAFSFERLAATTAVTVAPAVSVEALLLTSSGVLPKIISSNGSLHSFITTGAVITANVNATSTTASCTAVTAPSRAASAALVPQTVVSPLVGVPRQEHSPSSLLSPPAMLHVCNTEIRSSAVTSESPVAPTLSITDVRLGMALPLHASAIEDELGASGDAGHVSTGTRTDSKSSSTTPDGKASGGGRSKQRPQVCDTHHDHEKVRKPQEAQGSQQHFSHQEQLRRQALSVGPSVPSPARSSSSSRRRRRKRNVQRATSAAMTISTPSIPVAGGTQCSLSGARHPPPPPPPPPPRPTTPSRKSPTAAGQALPGVQATPEKAAARRNSNGSTTVSARRLFDALHSEHRSGDSDISAVNTMNPTNVNSSAASLAPSMAALTLNGSETSPACRMSSAETVTAMPQSANTPATAGPRPGQQRRGAGVTKVSPGRRVVRQSRSPFPSSAATIPRSSADAAARRDDTSDDACGTHAKLEDEDRLAEATSVEAAGCSALQGCTNLPTWRNAGISVSPTRSISSGDRSPSSHPQRSLLSSWLQSPPIRVATAAGGDDKVTLLSPVTPIGATASTASTPSRRSHAQLPHTPTSITAGGTSLSTPHQKLQPIQSMLPVAVARHPSQQLLLTAGASHQARKWTSIHLQSSATVSEALPSVPMAASAPSASSLLRITPILLSPSMAHPASAASPSVTGSSASAGTATAGSGAAASHLPALFAKPLSPLSSASRHEQHHHSHHPHPNQALHFSASTSGSSNNTMIASLAAPCMLPPSLSQGHPPKLAPEVSSDAAVQLQRAVVQSRYAPMTFMQTATSTLPSLVLSHSSSSRSPRLTSSTASRRIRSVALASAAPVSSQPARLSSKAETSAVATATPYKRTQRPTDSAKLSREARQTLPPSSPAVHSPSSSSQQLAADPGHQEQRLQTSTLARGNNSSRRPRAGLPPPLSVETLSDASVSAMRTSSAGTTESTGADKNIGKGDMGCGTNRPAMHNHGGGRCTPLAALFEDATDGRDQSRSAQLRPPASTVEGKEKRDREPSTPAAAVLPSSPVTLIAATTADVGGAICSDNHSSGSNGADVNRGASLDDDDIDVQAVGYDNDHSSAKQISQRSLWQQQQQLRPRLGDANAAEHPPARLSFLFDASTPVSMLSSALQRSSRSSRHQQPRQRRLPAGSGGGGGSGSDILRNVASHNSAASSPQKSAPSKRSSSDKHPV